MFLRNDYFYTVINETPFRFVLERQMFFMCNVQENNNILFFLTVWVLFWLEEMDSISSLAMSLLKRVNVLSVLVSFLFWPNVWPSFLSVSGLHDLLGSDLTIANEWSVLFLNRQYYHFFVCAKDVSSLYVHAGPTVRQTLTQLTGSWVSCRPWCDTSQAKNQTCSVRRSLKEPQTHSWSLFRRNFLNQ